MKEMSPHPISKNNNISKNISDKKLYPTTYQQKELSKDLYNIKCLAKKANISNGNNNYNFKITEKECSDINLIVRNSVEKINDLLNSKEFTKTNYQNKSIKRTSKNYITRIFTKEQEKEKPKSNNFTFNINNFITMGKNGQKNDRYEEFQDDLIKSENKAKEKTITNYNNNHRIKNLNFVSNRHRSTKNNINNNCNVNKILRSNVGKKKLFEDELNINCNNINIVSLTNNQKEKKNSDKSITVNIKNNNKYNDNNNLNISSIQKENNTNNNLKYAICEELNNKKYKFQPNLININSLSDERSINDFIIKGKEDEKKNKKIKRNNISMTKYGLTNNNTLKSKKKENSTTNKYNSPKITKNKNYKQIIEEKNKYYNNINLIKKIDEQQQKTKNHYYQSLKLNYPSNNGDTINLKQEKKQVGLSCEIMRNYSTQNINVHKVLNKIYSKEFPNKIKTNNMMKLMLFLNEYIINNNLLDDYYDINNRNKLDIYSKFLVEQINIDFPRENDVNFDKMVNSAKKIQRMWRKKRIGKFLGNKNEDYELKKMVLNKYIKKTGFKVKKIIGLFNTLVEDFNNIGNTQEMEEMFYNIQQIIKRKLTPYEKNNLYKEYINSIIYSY